jgi:hypothetical protein
MWSPPAPLKLSIVPRLCVPATQRWLDRNWNVASGGFSLTTLMVANRFGVSTRSAALAPGGLLHCGL